VPELKRLRRNIRKEETQDGTEEFGRFGRRETIHRKNVDDSKPDGKRKPTLNDQDTIGLGEN
jgi:hypothetical protein